MIWEDDEYKFNMFETYPFFSVGLFAAIAGVIFRILGWVLISRIFFLLIPMTIVAKLFVFLFFGLSEHPLTRFCIASFFIYIVCSIVEGGITAIWENTLVIGIINVIGTLSGVLAALGFLVRVFIAIFLK